MMLFYLPLWVLILMADTPKFKEQVLDSNVSIGYGVAIGDIDGDGKPDILLADKKQFVWYRNGDWKRFVLVENLTSGDNVCIAARDSDGDGKVEVAVGAQWNPSETSDTLQSGSVHFLERPEDPTKTWKAVQLHHEPTVHRMRWAQIGKSRYALIVVPLHGRGNQNGEGRGVRVFAYEKGSAGKPWKLLMVDSSMHMTHNLDVVASGKEDGSETIFVGGKEGVRAFSFDGSGWSQTFSNSARSFGEIRVGKIGIAGIHPMHGNELTLLRDDKVTTLANGMKQGHALAVSNLLGDETEEIVAGWREPDAAGETGIRLYTSRDGGLHWEPHWIDRNGMATEDLQLADLDGDGKTDIVASGRASRNLKIYWNRN